MMDSKRTRGNEENTVESSGALCVDTNGLDMKNVGPKNLLNAGPVGQARLKKRVC